MSYYACRMMIKRSKENHVLKCRQLFHQLIIDIYIKIES